MSTVQKLGISYDPHKVRMFAPHYSLLCAVLLRETGWLTLLCPSLSIPACLHHAAQLKANLAMATQRLNLLINKKVNDVKRRKLEVANLLKEKPPREEEARIRCESIINMDNAIEAFEIVKLHCSLLLERVAVANAPSSDKGCPSDLVSVVCTVIWASERAGVAELVDASNQLGKKYGKDILSQARTNQGGCVNERVLSRLTHSPPSAATVNGYMTFIAEEFGVEYRPTSLPDALARQAMPPPTGFSVAPSKLRTGALEGEQLAYTEPDIPAMVMPVPKAPPASTSPPAYAHVVDSPPPYHVTGELVIPEAPSLMSRGTQVEDSDGASNGPSSPSVDCQPKYDVDSLAARFAALKNSST
jgi:hypothetical protein